MAKKLTQEDFLKQMYYVHGENIDFSEAVYINDCTKVKCICNKCGNVSKLEVEIENILKNNKVKHVICYSPEWLGLQHLDFYLPDYNIAIECQGNQHYESRDFFGGETEFSKVLERDTRKAKLCKENGVKLLYFTHYSKIKEENNIYKNKDKLLEEILHNAKSIRDFTKSNK